MVGKKAYAGLTRKINDAENAKNGTLYSHQVIDTFAQDIYSQATTSSLEYKLDYINSNPDIYEEKLVDIFY